MDAVSPVRSPSAIVALARPARGRAPSVSTPAHARSSLIAVDVQDPGNLGAIVRVAEAGGATGVIAAGACADPFGWKALRGSMGSALRLPIGVAPRRGGGRRDARRHGCRIVATVPRGGRSLYDVDLRGAVGDPVGGEGAGLTPRLIEAADERRRRFRWRRRSNR